MPGLPEAVASVPFTFLGRGQTWPLQAAGKGEFKEGLHLEGSHGFPQTDQYIQELCHRG